MPETQKCEHPDITTSKGFEDMIRRFVGLGPSDGLCEWCVYFKDEPKAGSPCGDCNSWDHFERAAVRQDRIIAIEVGDTVRVSPNVGEPFTGEVLDKFWSWQGDKYIDLGYLVRLPDGRQETYQLREHSLTVVKQAPKEED